MFIYEALINGKRVGNLCTDERKAREILVKYMKYDRSLHIPTHEVNAWIPDILSGRFYEHRMGCGVVWSIRRHEVDCTI